jgi:hypothetical protein
MVDFEHSDKRIYIAGVFEKAGAQITELLFFALV